MLTGLRQSFVHLQHVLHGTAARSTSAYRSAPTLPCSTKTTFPPSGNIMRRGKAFCRPTNCQTSSSAHGKFQPPPHHHWFFKCRWCTTKIVKMVYMFCGITLVKPTQFRLFKVFFKSWIKLCIKFT